MSHSHSNLLIQNLSLKFNENYLFNNLSVEIPKNKFTSILGQSGVGKSSLLRFIAGLTIDKCASFTSGSVSYDNQTLRGKVAYMAQRDLLMPWRTILDNVLIGHQLRKQINNELKVRAIHLLQKVGLGSVIYKRPAALSGGMRQRVALVRTIIENKQIILMDEPFSALDRITRFKMHELMIDLLNHCTVIFITHDPLEALRISDHIYLLSGRPATLESVIKLNGNKPRNIEDPSLLKQEGELLRKLMQATEINPC